MWHANSIQVKCERSLDDWYRSKIWCMLIEYSWEFWSEMHHFEPYSQPVSSWLQWSFKEIIACLATDETFDRHHSYVCTCNNVKWHRRKNCLWKDIQGEIIVLECMHMMSVLEFLTIIELLISIDIPNVCHLIFQGLTVDPRKSKCVQWFTTRHCSVTHYCDLKSVNKRKY